MSKMLNIRFQKIMYNMYKVYICQDDIQFKLKFLQQIQLVHRIISSIKRTVCVNVCSYVCIYVCIEEGWDEELLLLPCRAHTFGVLCRYSFCKYKLKLSHDFLARKFYNGSVIWHYKNICLNISGGVTRHGSATRINWLQVQDFYHYGTPNSDT